MIFYYFSKIDVLSNSPQCLHLMAPNFIFSAQNGHLFCFFNSIAIELSISTRLDLLQFLQASFFEIWRYKLNNIGNINNIYMPTNLLIKINIIQINTSIKKVLL